MFLAPPWGGMEYSTDDNYSVYRSLRPDIKKIMDKVLDFSEKIVLCLPRNINVEEIVGLLVESFEEKGRVCERAAVEIEKIYLNNKFKMNLVYFGNASKVVLLKFKFLKENRSRNLLNIARFIRKCLEKKRGGLESRKKRLLKD